MTGRRTLVLLAFLAGCSGAPRASNPPVAALAAPEPADWRWDLTPEAVLAARLATLVALPDRDRTFANTIAALEAASSDYDETTNHLSLFAEIHQDAAVRTASNACADEVARVATARDSRLDVYRAVQ